MASTESLRSIILSEQSRKGSVASDARSEARIARALASQYLFGRRDSVVGIQEQVKFVPHWSSATTEAAAHLSAAVRSARSHRNSVQNNSSRVVASRTSVLYPGTAPSSVIQLPVLSKSSSKMADNGMMDDSEHFPSFDDRVRASTRNVVRSGRLSPTHSAHAGLYRSNLMSVALEKRAKKVRFYRNGDRFFKGMIYAVSPERFRTFESLMAELTASPLGDKTVLPHGVRHIFTLDGSRKIISLDEMEEGESYVCASTQAFKRMDYPRSTTPSWLPGQAQHRPISTMPLYEEEENRDYIKPKLVTIVRSGTKPRKAVRILLNKKTAHSFDQVLNDITEAVKLDTGAVRKVYTLGGKQVTCLQDFFKDDSVFVAYGNEKYSLDDFDVDDNEVKFSSAYKSVRQKERITLKSPKAPRRMPLSASSSNSSIKSGYPDLSNRKPGATPKSPKSQRRAFAANGNLQNGSSGSAANLPKELTTKYKIGKVIGEGNFATVKECIEKARKKQFALKIISKARCQGKEEMIENEVNILRQMKHVNIIRLVEELDTNDSLYLVMELVNGGDLFEAIAASTKYTERDASGMMYNLGCAINYLHSLNIVHRDIKPENIMVCEHPDGTLSLKLGDFGLATVVREPLYTVCGTPTYVAPEVLAEVGYGLKIDVWATGVITYILLCGFPPFVSPTNSQDDLFDRIMSGKYEFPSPFWDDISDSAKELISHMLLVDPDDRFSAAEVLEHPWVSDDLAKDNDLHTAIAKGLAANFTPKKPKSSQPGVALITSTALDKASRYFPGRKHQPVQQFNNLHDEEEVF